MDLVVAAAPQKCVGDSVAVNLVVAAAANGILDIPMRIAVEQQRIGDAAARHMVSGVE
jgi:hypothetical protein